MHWKFHKKLQQPVSSALVSASWSADRNAQIRRCRMHNILLSSEAFTFFLHVYLLVLSFSYAKQLLGGVGVAITSVARGPRGRTPRLSFVFFFFFFVYFYFAAC